MTPRRALVVELTVMGALIAASICFPRQLTSLLGSVPEAYLHSKVVHVLAATLFFGNVVIGTLWETRSLLSRRVDVIRHTYETVTFLDAFFTAPLVLTALLSGLVLGTLSGGVFSRGWLTLAFALFSASGVVWVALDIPSQHRTTALLRAAHEDAAREAPPALLRLLRFRLVLNVCAIVPLLGVLVLMVEKPSIPWLEPRRGVTAPNAEESSSRDLDGRRSK